MASLSRTWELFSSSAVVNTVDVADVVFVVFVVIVVVVAAEAAAVETIETVSTGVCGITSVGTMPGDTGADGINGTEVVVVLVVVVVVTVVDSIVETIIGGIGDGAPIMDCVGDISPNLLPISGISFSIADCCCGGGGGGDDGGGNNDCGGGVGDCGTGTWDTIIWLQGIIVSLEVKIGVIGNDAVIAFVSILGNGDGIRGTAETGRFSIGTDVVCVSSWDATECVGL